MQIVLSVLLVGMCMGLSSQVVAWHGVIASKDFEFWLGMPGSGLELILAAISVVVVFAVGRRHLKWVLPFFAVYLAFTVGQTWYRLNSAFVSHPLVLVTDELEPTTTKLRDALQAARLANAEAATLQDLIEAGVIKDATFLDGKWYGAEAYSWSGGYDEQGRFRGSITVAGDPARNVPAWTLHLDSAPPRWGGGEPRSDLPMLHRTRALSYRR